MKNKKINGLLALLSGLFCMGIYIFFCDIIHFDAIDSGLIATGLTILILVFIKRYRIFKEEFAKFLEENASRLTSLDKVEKIKEFAKFKRGISGEPPDIDKAIDKAWEEHDREKKAKERGE